MSALFQQGDGAALRFYIDPAELPLTRRNAVIKSIRKSGGVLALLPRDADIILAVNGTADAQIYASSSSGKVVLDHEWVKYCVDTGKMAGKEEGWGGFRIVMHGSEDGNHSDDLEGDGGQHEGDGGSEYGVEELLQPTTASEPPDGTVLEFNDRASARISVQSDKSKAINGKPGVPPVSTHFEGASFPGTGFITPEIPPGFNNNQLGNAFNLNTLIGAGYNPFGNANVFNPFGGLNPLLAQATQFAAQSPFGQTFNPGAAQQNLLQMAQQGMIPLAALPPQMLPQLNLLYAQAAANGLYGLPSLDVTAGSQLNTSVVPPLQSAAPSPAKVVSPITPVTPSSLLRFPTSVSTSPFADSHLSTPSLSPSSTRRAPPSSFSASDRSSPSARDLSREVPSKQSNKNGSMPRVQPTSAPNAGSAHGKKKIFVTELGRPLKFFVAGAVKNRCALLDIVKSNGGSIGSQSECDYVLVNAQASTRELSSVANLKKPILRQTWIDKCVESNRLVSMTNYEIEMYSKKKVRTSEITETSISTTPSKSSGSGIAQPYAACDSSSRRPLADKETSSQNKQSAAPRHPDQETGPSSLSSKKQSREAAFVLPSPPTARVRSGGGYAFTHEDSEYLIKFFNARLAQDPELSSRDILKEMGAKTGQNYRSFDSWLFYYKSQEMVFKKYINFPRPEGVSSTVAEESERDDGNDSEDGAGTPESTVVNKSNARTYNKFTEEEDQYFATFVARSYRKDPKRTQLSMCEELAKKFPRHSANSWSKHWWHMRGGQRAPGDEPRSSAPESRPESTSPAPNNEDSDMPPKPPTKVVPRGKGSLWTYEDEHYLTVYAIWKLRKAPGTTMEVIIHDVAGNATHHTEKAWMLHFKKYQENFIQDIFGPESQELEEYYAEKARNADVEEDLENEVIEIPDSDEEYDEERDEDDSEAPGHEEESDSELNEQAPQDSPAAETSTRMKPVRYTEQDFQDVVSHLAALKYTVAVCTISVWESFQKSHKAHTSKSWVEYVRGKRDEIGVELQKRSARHTTTGPPKSTGKRAASPTPLQNGSSAQRRRLNSDSALDLESPELV